MLNYYAFIKQIDHFFVKNTSFLMLVSWVQSFSDIGCTARVKGTDRTWSSIATVGYIKKIDGGEKTKATLYWKGS